MGDRVFLTSALVADQWSASRPDRFTTRDITCDIRGHIHNFRDWRRHLVKNYLWSYWPSSPLKQYPSARILKNYLTMMMMMMMIQLYRNVKQIQKKQNKR
jgi:hypothetical protein